MNTSYSKDAAKVLSRLDVPTKHRIRAAIHGIPQGDIKKLRGSTNLCRLRVGIWRILFMHEDDGVFIADIVPRGDAYK